MYLDFVSEASSESSATGSEPELVGLSDDSEIDDLLAGNAPKPSGPAATQDGPSKAKKATAGASASTAGTVISNH